VYKGIVMEQHEDYMIVMSRDGLFQKALPIKNVKLGSEVYYHPLPYHKKVKTYYLDNFRRFISVPVGVLTLVFLVILLVIPMYFTVGSSSPYAYVNVDINPSIQIELDKRLEMLSIKPVNADATVLIEQLDDLKGKKIEVVLEEIMEESEDAGLTKNGKNMIVGVNYLERNKGNLINFEKLKQLPGSEWGIVSFIIPKEVREIAEAKHISMNKVMLERVNETHNQIFNLKPKEREIIHSFLNYKFKEGQDSSKTTQDYQFPPSLQKKNNN